MQSCAAPMPMSSHTGYGGGSGYTTGYYNPAMQSFGPPMPMPIASYGEYGGYGGYSPKRYKTEFGITETLQDLMDSARSIDLVSLLG